MSRLHVVTGRDPAALLESAASDFLNMSRLPGNEPFASPRYLLVLRQGGLREDLFRIAAERGVPGWFEAPICVFHELPAWLGATNRRRLGDFERAALLEHLLRENAASLLHGREGAFLGAAEQLVGELCADDVAPAAFAAAVESLAGREEFERRRDAALARTYAAYVAELARLGRRDGRDALADTARAIQTAPDRLVEQLGGRREIRILGLADLRGGWKSLLRALLGAPAIDRITLYATEGLTLPPDFAPTCEQVRGRDGAAIQRLTDAVERSGAVEVIGAVDADAELDAVAARIRALVDAGAAPHRIAVISREARPYTDLAIRALARAGLPATARRRTGYREIPVVRAVLALLRAGADGWTRHGLVELGSHPYLASSVDARVVNYIGFRERVTGLDGWRAALGRLLDEARAAEAAPEGDEERRARTLPFTWVERARDGFEQFADQARVIEATRPLAEWLAWLEGWLTDDAWRVEGRLGRVPDDRWDVVRLDQLGWSSLRAIVTDWLAAQKQWPGEDGALTAREFLERLESILEGDVALWTASGHGVQVVEALAASHRSFDHVFLVGMDAGRFPRPAPSSLLLSEHDREVLRSAGLPLDVTADWDARERALFHTIVAGATSSLTVSYVRLDELGGEAIPSAFVDALLDSRRSEMRPGRTLPVIRSAELAAHAYRAAQIERDRATGRLSPWNGRIESPELVAWLGDAFGDTRQWSPTQIESYAKCPWAYFSQRLLRVEAREDPDEDMDKRARGSVLHAAMKRFYDRARDRTGAPVFLTETDRPWAIPLLAESLREALAGAGRGLWLGHPALRNAKYAELERMLQRYLAFEMEENRKAFDGRTTAGRTIRTAVDAHELPFDGIVLERGGVVFLFRGSIDRVEVGADERSDSAWVAAVDYKTTKYSAPGAGKKEAWDDGVVLQIPLYAHALAVLRPGTAVARVEYRAIKTAERVHNLSLVRVKKAGVEADADARAKMEQALSAVARHVVRIRAGEFPARPAASCNCPPFCHAWDICRVKGGPDDGRNR
jgi:RecB family exonuclease